MYLDPQNCVKPGWKISWNVSKKNNSFHNVVNFVSVLQEKGFESVHHYLEYLKSGKKQTTKSKDSEEEEEEEEEE